MKNYPDQLDILYHDRSEGLTNDDYPDDYKEWLGKFTNLCEEIKTALPKDKGHLLAMELDSVLAAFASIHQETGYKLGFKDAYRLSMTVLMEAV